MQTSTPEQEKLLRQMAVRQVSSGRGSAFFNLLFPLTVLGSFFAFYLMPVLVSELMTETPKWLETYLMLSPAPTVMAAFAAYSFIRHQRLKPVIAMLRMEIEKEDIMLNTDVYKRQ